jgi:hypothetical protein
MPTTDLRASRFDATVWQMFDPIPILLARESVRARIEGPLPERSPARSRTLVASILHRLADRVDARTLPAAHPLSARAARSARPGQ